MILIGGYNSEEKTNIALKNDIHFLTNYFY